MKDFLPRLLATITRHSRQQVLNLDWGIGNGSAVYKIFRLWEYLFWRRCGTNGIGDNIRKEAESNACFVDGEIVVVRHFYTMEALMMYSEYLIKQFFKVPDFGFKFVPIPQFATPTGFPSLPSIFSFAVVRDNNGSVITTTGTTNTITSYAFTASGSNNLLAVGYSNQGGSSADRNPSATFNSVSMTRESYVFGGVRPMSAAIFSLIAQTGTHNIVVTVNASDQILVMAVSYSGASQGAIDGASSSNNQTGNASTTITSSTNGWQVSHASIWDATAGWSGSAVSIATRDNGKTADTNGSVSGSITMTASASANGGSIATLAFGTAETTAPVNIKLWGAGGGSSACAACSGAGGGAGAYVTNAAYIVNSGKGYALKVGLGGGGGRAGGAGVGGAGGTGQATGGTGGVGGNAEAGGGGGSSSFDTGALIASGGGGAGAGSQTSGDGLGGVGSTTTVGGVGGAGGGAQGGSGGGGAASTNGSNGGTSGAGGAGGTGGTTQTGTNGTGGNGGRINEGGGGGGSSAGTAGNGATGGALSGTVGGTGGAGSGGAAGGTSGANAGTVGGVVDSGGGGAGGASTTFGGVGGAPGAGGGGSGDNNVNRAGVSGAAGRVVVQALLGVITSATGGTKTSDATYDYWTFTADGTWTPTIPAAATATAGFLFLMV